MALTNFENHTHDLTDTEIALSEIVLDVLKKATKEKQKCNGQIIAEVAFFSQLEINITSSRLRAIIHYLRTIRHIPVLATSRGYYLSFNLADIAIQVKSLDERIRSIQQVRDSLYQIQKEHESNQHTSS